MSRGRTGDKKKRTGSCVYVFFFFVPRFSLTHRRRGKEGRFVIQSLVAGRTGLDVLAYYSYLHFFFSSPLVIWDITGFVAEAFRLRTYRYCKGS